MHALEKRLEDDSAIILDFDPLSDLISVIRVVSDAEPRFLKQRNFPTALSALQERLMKRIKEESGTPFGDDADELEREEMEARSLRWTIRNLAALLESDQKMIDAVCENLEAHEVECREQSKIHARHALLSDDDDDFDDRSPVFEPFDVDAIFADL